MKKYILKYFFAAAVLNAFSIYFLSCSDSDAAIVSSHGTYVFEYADSESSPSVRLSVFVQTQSEAQRAQQLTVTDKKTERKWIINEPVIFSGNNKNWVGWSKLYPASGENFQSASYDVLYTDAAGTEAESAFTISCKKELFEVPYSKVRSVINSSLNETCAVYDKDMNMLYYGSYKKNWTKKSLIKRDYNRAAFVRKLLSNSTTTLVFLMPVENLDDEEN